MHTSAARLLHRGVALTMLVAWLSLAAQVRLLIGEDGLAPIGELIEALRATGQAGFWQFPTFMWWLNSDGVLLAGTVLGAGLALCALLGIAARPCLALSAPLYLSYAVGGQSFLGFQWDSLAVELCLLAALLPEDNQEPIARWLLRLLLFKLMFESGLAKWQSHSGDWLDGTAMLHYYETAPLPAPLALVFHRLPEGWHRFESYWALFFELAVPFLIFFGRWPRRIALAVFTLFFVVDALTANYGFFILQAAALCAVLLEDDDASRLTGRPPPPPRHPGTRSRLPVAILGAAWLTLSILGGLTRFADIIWLPELQAAARPLRVANNYHLFGHITTERIEPEFQTLGEDGWRAQHLRYKPGPLDRRPPYVAPHQPRVDFRLWFYGLSYRRGMPRYVETLLSRLCNNPAAVQPLFPEPLPEAPEAVQIVFWRTTFADSGGDWWQREEVDRTGPLPCTDLP